MIERRNEMKEATVFRNLLCAGLICLLLGIGVADLQAQEAASQANETQELAKKTQNPVSNLISIPFQNNFNFGAGPDGEMQYILNLQPVYPMRLAEGWNLINRTILPVIANPSGLGGETGLGDLQYQGFFSPSKPGRIIWGVGPILGFPTATDDTLGYGRWTAGPAAVALTMRGPWVVGALVNQQWDYAGWTDRHVSFMLIQPFINYNLPGGWYVNTVPIITADWERASGDEWLVPLGAGVGKLHRFGRLPVNLQLGAYGNVERPEYAPDWQLRFQVQFLFPK
jgi:hypothetical protein